MTRRPLSSPIAEADADIRAFAERIGFGQCVHAVRRTLLTTPLGWLLVAWYAWPRVPHLRFELWLGGFACLWLASLALLGGVARQRAARDLRVSRLVAVAAIDGVCWGSMSWLLIGFTPTLDAWLTCVLCGVVAVYAPAYMTYIRAFAVSLGAIWITVVASAIALPGRPAELERVAGLTLFFVLLGYQMRPVAGRVLEGIRLQLSNASLAEQLRDALVSVRHESETDVLTGQPNRRALDLLLKHQVAHSRLSGSPFCLLMVDIDHFKQINDSHGHGVGDDTLRAFAQRVRQHLRAGDACARYGGEEFVLVLPGTKLGEALEVAERLRLGISSAPLVDRPPIQITVSIGASQYQAEEPIGQLLARADSAVYVAKRNGRNQVRVPEPVSALTAT